MQTKPHTDGALPFSKVFLMLFESHNRLVKWAGL